MEQPVRGLTSLMQQKDLPVLIAVNERGIFVIDQIECVSFNDYTCNRSTSNTFPFLDVTARTQVRGTFVGLRETEQRERSGVYAVYISAVRRSRERNCRHQTYANLHPPSCHDRRLNNPLHRSGQAAERERRGRGPRRRESV